jgi:hypothetical protein
VALLGIMYAGATAPQTMVDTTGLVQAGGSIAAEEASTQAGGLQEPPKEETS